jgi:hypothetical protein
MTWGIVLVSPIEQLISRLQDLRTYPLKATTQREPLVGSRRKAKSLEGSHISVTALGRYVPTEAVRFFVRFSDRLRRLDLMSS